MGIELLVRGGRGVRLTPAARSLLPYIERALTEFQAGLDLVRNESDVVRGRISVVEVPLDSALVFRDVGLSWRQRKAEVEPAAVRLFREMVLTNGPGLLAGLVERRSRLASPYDDGPEFSIPL